MELGLRKLACRAAMIVAVAGGAAAAQAQSGGSEGQQPPEPTPPLTAEGLDALFEEAERITEFAQASQERIDDMSAETSRLLREYKGVLREIESLKAYNAQQRRVVANQEQEISELQQSIDEVVAIRREITPLMLRMIQALEQFVELDMPFLLESRRERIANLRDFLDASNIAPSAKFRLVLEAYQNEMDYGRTIETYKSNVVIDGAERQANILRIGRVVLAYETLDGETVGFWNKAAGQWAQLPASFTRGIETAIAYANDQAAPNMYVLPVPGPTESQEQAQ